MKIATERLKTHFASQMEGSLSITVAEINVAFAVDEEHDETVISLLVCPLDIAVQWGISTWVKCIVILPLK